jgi:hypothetical protein
MPGLRWSEEALEYAIGLRNPDSNFLKLIIARLLTLLRTLKTRSSTSEMRYLGFMYGRGVGLCLSVGGKVATFANAFFLHVSALDVMFRMKLPISTVLSCCGDVAVVKTQRLLIANDLRVSVNSVMSFSMLFISRWTFTG